MDATSLALSWLLLAQTGGAGSAPNPFNFRDTESSPRRTAPAATIQEEQPVERDRGASPWSDRNSNQALKELDEKTLSHNRTLQKEIPQPSARSPLFRDTPAPNASEAPAWGGAATPRPRAGEAARTDSFGAPVDEDRAPAENTRAAGWGVNEATVRPIGNTRDEHLDGALLIPLRSRSGQFSPSEVLTQALTAPAGVKVPGRGVTLLEVVSRAGDRTQQLRVTKAYWRLSIAEAEYYWRLDTRRWTSQLVPHRGKPNDGNIIRTLQASAAARLNEAELALLVAQHEVAEFVQRSDAEDLPLAADQPFLGNYRTYFRELFADRDPPGRTQLIDRSLPIRREQIDSRTKAVFSSDEAMHTAIDEYNRGVADVDALWGCLEDLHRERLMFLNAVRDYNYDIAEYATTVATGGMPSSTLVSMMIRTTHPEVASPTSSPGHNSSNTFLQRQPTRVRPIEYQQEETGSNSAAEGRSSQAPPFQAHPTDNHPAEFVEQRKPVSVMVPPDRERVTPAEAHAAPERDRVQHADFRENVTAGEPQQMPPLVPLQAARETPKKPVSVMVRPVRE